MTPVWGSVAICRYRTLARQPATRGDPNEPVTALPGSAHADDVADRVQTGGHGPVAEQPSAKADRETATRKRRRGPGDHRVEEDADGRVRSVFAARSQSHRQRRPEHRRKVIAGRAGPAGRRVCGVGHDVCYRHVGCPAILRLFTINVLYTLPLLQKKYPGIVDCSLFRPLSILIRAWLYLFVDKSCFSSDPHGSSVKIQKK